MRKAICNSIAAGIFIGIGGSVFLAIENKVVGAIFFTVARSVSVNSTSCCTVVRR